MNLIKLIFVVLFITSINAVYSQEHQTAEIQIEETLSGDLNQDTSDILILNNHDRSISIISILRGLSGMAILILTGFLLSRDKTKIPWRTVISGLIIQVTLAAGMLYVPFVRSIFELLGLIFVKILDFTKAGSEFLLGDLMDENTYGFIFMFQVLPTIIFFSALASLLYYWGIIQKIVWALAWIFTRAMHISGVEALSVAGNIFLGQTESPLMIKPYLEKLGKSEILLVMTGGMATMAGGVLAAYIALLGGDDPRLRLEFAKHLMAASVMAAPAAVIFSKMLVPPEDKINKQIKISREKIGHNVLDAITNGTGDGLKLAVNVAAMLLVFLAFIAMFNFITGKIGEWTSLNDIIAASTNGKYESLSLQFILGYTFAPLMWIIGICPQDIIIVGRLLGEKLILTEFIGYISLAELKATGMFAEPKSIIMSTYILCGFANFSSIGIQIGGIGALAPGQRILLSRYGIPSVIAGTLASLMSATIIGMII